MKATREQKARMQEYYLRNREQICMQKKLYYQTNRERLLASPAMKETSKRYKEAHKEQILARTRNWQRTHREHVNAYRVYYAKKIKAEVISLYSRGRNCCRRCGFSDMRALTIDHIEGGGNQHRKEVGGDWYHWLRREKKTQEYQVLCMNCQFLKRAERREY